VVQVCSSGDGLIGNVVIYPGKSYYSKHHNSLA
jgi:hypothetical protein